MTTHEEDERAARLREAILLKRAAARSRQGSQSGASSAESGLPQRPADSEARLGELQRPLWLIDRLDPDSAAYNLANAFRVRGPLDRTKLEDAFNTVVARHRILRSTFEAREEAVLQVVHSVTRFELERVEAGSLELLEAAVREARVPFDLERGPLVRMVLIEGGSAPEPMLLLVLHHILADERSLGVFWSELAEAYAGAELGELAPAQYDDYVHWCEQRAGGDRSGELERWRQRLDPLPEELDLPFEGSADEGASSKARGRLLVETLGGEVGAGVRRLAVAAGTTPFAVFAFAYRLLLDRYCEGRDVAFATPASKRSHPATARMIGYFLSPVVVRARVDEEQPVEEGLREFGRELRALLADTGVPFNELAEHLAPPRQRDRHPIFQTMFVYQQSSAPPNLGEAQLEPVGLDLRESKFDLTLFVDERDSSFELAVEYRADRFGERWLRALLGHYASLLEHLVQDPARRVAQLSMLGTEEEQVLRALALGAALDASGEAMLPRQILARARLAPEAAAVVCGDTRWSYAELERAARRIATHLVRSGVAPGERVGLFLERSPWMIAGVLGALWAGAAYVPLDPGYPEQRNRDVLADASVAAVLTTSDLRGRLPEGEWSTLEVDGLSAELPFDEARCDPASTQPAYLLYTSGSTGRPKGVVITHGNLRASNAARASVYASQPRRFLLLPSIAFDSSVAGLFWTLAEGGALVVPLDEQAKDPRRLVELCVAEAVTSLLCVPSLYAYLLKEGGERLQSLDTAIVAGESCSSQLVADHRRVLPRARLYNEYGPTEATVWAAVHEMSEEDASRAVAIGRPIPGARLEVLDARGRLLPAGLPGEGWISGPTVAQGYWERPELTRERFAVNPNRAVEGQVSYRTGDRMSWAADGRLLFHGRADEQIKLRGFRIEPGEIEAVLCEDARVREAAVVVRASGSNAEIQRLVAFLELTQEGADDGRRERLAERLPDYMVPSRIVELSALPRLPNGKVDRARLRSIELEPEPRGAVEERIPSAVEEGLLSLWRGMLGVPEVGLHDNLFELGGHSLLIVEMASVIERDFGVELTAADVFQTPTVEELAARVAQRSAPGAPTYAHLFPIQPKGRKSPLVFCVPHFFSESFAAKFRGERPVYGMRGVSLRAEGNLGRWRTMTALAEELVEELRRRFGDEPCVMLGYSFGASMAVEAVRLMEQRGMPVERLILIAPMPLNFYRFGPLRLELEGLRKPLSELSTGEALRMYASANHPFRRRPYERIWRRLSVQPWRQIQRWIGKRRLARGLPLTPRILHADVRIDRFRLHSRWRPGTLRTPTVVFNAKEPSTDAAATYRALFEGPFEVVPTPDPHLDEASVAAAKELILGHLDELVGP